jgi:hypothetical protein
MPKAVQGTTESPVTERGLGTVATNALKGIFQTSPMYLGEMNPEDVKQQYQDIVLDSVINDNGHTFGTFDTSYTDAPNMADVETGDGGLPATAYLPNPTSPGEGSINASDQKEAPDGYGEATPNQWGSGVGSQLSPHDASKKLSGQTLGDYVLGKSSKD